METKDYLKQLLIKLKAPIPHQWRTQSFSKYKPQATVLAYIDARDVMDMLDMYCDYGWSREHYSLDGKLYCRIGIFMPDGSIQSRSDCGTEGNTEPSKSEASDSFKRAAVNFGIGRFLYDMKVQYVDADGIKADADRTADGKVYKKFPNPVDKQGKKITDLTTYINNLNPNAPKAPVQITEPTPAQQVAQMQKQPEPISEEELARYKDIIDGFTVKADLNNYYKGLTADVQGNLTIQGYLKDRQEFIKKQG